MSARLVLPQRHTVLVFLRQAVSVCLVLALEVSAAGPDAASLFKEGRKAEKAGEVVRAYLLYSEAAALAPKRREYWDRSQALRTRAALKGLALPRADTKVKDASPVPDLPSDAAPAGLATSISAADLAEVERLKPPPDLQVSRERKSINIRANAKSLFEQVARAYGLQVVFDADYQPGSPLRFQVDDADYREALRALEAATGSFVFPLSERLIMVAKDTQQKRTELEPTVGVSVLLPYTVTPQEVQELARGVQATMEIQKLAIDASQRMVLIKDRISKVLPAQLLFEQLAHPRAQVMVQMQFLEIDRTALTSYGLLTPYQFPIYWVGKNFISGVTGQSLAKFLFGKTLLGIGISNAQLFATMSRSTAKILLNSSLRSVDGQPATLHVGDKYPIVTAGFLGGGFTGVPPTFNFEDLGLLMKVTPHVHAEGEVTLDVDAEFKVLSGSSYNGIPAISTRKLESKVRLKAGEWGIVAGLMSYNEARSISGVPGLSRLPLLGPLYRQNDRNESGNEIVILLKPVILDPPASDIVTRMISVGSDGRLKIPL